LGDFVGRLLIVKDGALGKLTSSSNSSSNFGEFLMGDPRIRSPVDLEASLKGYELREFGALKS